jgi:hypothetical protein
MMAEKVTLGACPRCGKSEGALKGGTSGRFRFYVSCTACSFMTAMARTEGIAVKLWNEAKSAKRSVLRSTE